MYLVMVKLSRLHTTSPQRVADNWKSPYFMEIFQCQVDIFAMFVSQRLEDLPIHLASNCRLPRRFLSHLDPSVAQLLSSCQMIQSAEITLVQIIQQVKYARKKPSLPQTKPLQTAKFLPTHPISQQTHFRL